MDPNFHAPSSSPCTKPKLLRLQQAPTLEKIIEPPHKESACESHPITDVCSEKLIEKITEIELKDLDLIR